MFIYSFITNSCIKKLIIQYKNILFQRGIHQLQQLHHSAHPDGTDHSKTRAYPLMVQGLRTNPNDPECHILCFDIEALVGQ